MRILSWNLFHGRSVPDRRGPLRGEFAAALAGWEWDVALLQEVPPWWPDSLAAATGSSARSVLTSRYEALFVRRMLAERRPGLMKASGGGANAILTRGAVPAEHRAQRLRVWPERRVVHAVRLGPTWVANVHAHHGPRARTEADLHKAVAAATEWADVRPLIFGGDLNVTKPELDGFAHAGGHHVDHVLVRGDSVEAQSQVLDAGDLSDHRPLLVDL